MSPPSSIGSRMRATSPRIRSAFASPRSRSPGEKEVSREEILTTAGVTGRASLLFLDADAARARLMANPWIADAAVLKLYPDRLQITITERQAFALWQKDGQRQRHRRRRHRARAVRRGPLSRPAACGRHGRRAPGQGLSRRRRPLPRYPLGAARVDPGGAAALESAARRTASTCGCRKRNVEQALDRLVDARPRQEAAVARHHDGRSALARSRDRAAVRRRGAGARRGAERRKKKKKGGDA